MRWPWALVLAIGVVAACGPDPDEDALAICGQVGEARVAISSFEGGITRTNDFDVVSMYLMDLYGITEFLQDWVYIASDDLNGPVRTSARAALSRTGMYQDGTNPITGQELIDNLRSAQHQWEQLEQACRELDAA